MQGIFEKGQYFFKILRKTNFYTILKYFVENYVEGFPCLMNQPKSRAFCTVASSVRF